jgi:F-type H+-transporting ATPase subunit a
LKNPKTILIAIGALVLIGIGFLFFRSPKPHIEIKAETLAEIGPFPIVNTWVTSLLVIAVITLIAFLATRSIKLIPSGLQNIVEAVMEALYNICINTAGEKNAKRFFPVIMTIFVYIWIANWMALLPFFNAIGAFQEQKADHFYHEATVFNETAGIGWIPPNRSEIEFHEEEAPSWEQVEAIDAEIDEAEAAGAPKAEIDALKDARHDAELHAREEAINMNLATAAGLELDYSACEEIEDTEEKHHCEHEIALEPENVAAAQAKLDEDGKKIGLIYPYFRSMNTDINSPLSIAIMAMIFVEFWGITALGLFKYGSKFFNFSSPIFFFVGLLELVAEFARVISFTFRLFGNMLAGEILLLVMTFLAPFLVALPFYGLETFVGVIQAFVFAMLTLVFAVLATSAHDGHGDEHDEHGEHGEHDDGYVPYTGPDVPLQGPAPVSR